MLMEDTLFRPLVVFNRIGCVSNHASTPADSRHQIYNSVHREDVMNKRSPKRGYTLPGDSKVRKNGSKTND